MNKRAKEIIDNYRLLAIEKNLNSYGIVVRVDDEDTEHRFRSDDRECLYSASKTFTSVAIGIAQDEGLLKVTDKLLDHFPEFADKASAGTEETTLRDLLHMMGGKEFPDHPRQSELAMQCDWLEYYVNAPLKDKPGTKFFYTNFCTYALSRVIAKVSGVDLKEYLRPRLFEPMGLYGINWEECPKGYSIGATGLYLKTSELHRMGVMLLHKGEYNGKRIVSADYVNAMHTDIVQTFVPWAMTEPHVAHYGYQVWRCDYKGADDIWAFRADGMYGQYSIVIPDKQIVITITGHNELNSYEVIRAAFASVQ